MTDPIGKGLALPLSNRTMSKIYKTIPPTVIYLSYHKPAFFDDPKAAAAFGLETRVYRRIKSLAEANALQRRLLKKVQRMLDAKRNLDFKHFNNVLLAIQPGAWVCEYDHRTRHTRLVTSKSGSIPVPVYQRIIYIHPKEFCK
jgi:hypothetical protein